MATVVYPAIIERAGGGFSVFFPDLPGCTSAGATSSEAALNAEEALAGHIIEMVRQGLTLPEPTDLAAMERDLEVDEIARVMVRAERTGKAVRLNITLDEGLVAAIDKVARNRSGFLAEAARDALANRRVKEPV